jgi:hypothetical protein
MTIQTGEQTMSDDTAGERKAADQDTQEMRSVSQSRRNLLKAAVIGSAAVAATAGVGAGAAALTGRKELNPLDQIAWIIHGSPGDPCAVCTTHTNEANFVTADTFNGNSSMYLWIRFLNVLPGTYKVDVSPTIHDSTASSCPTSAPFRYQSPSSAVTQWALAPKNFECHPHALSELPPGTHTDALPASFTITDTKCLLVLVHLKYCASGDNTYTVTGSLLQKQGTTDTYTVIQTCNHNITIDKHAPDV